MNGGEPSAVLRDVRTLFAAGAIGGLTDGQLLERFMARRDAAAEEAFTALVRRHGPMVWGVCRRALHDPNDAADAFQATFLVLVRRAAAVRVEDSLGRWLHGVSRRVAARARKASARRAALEVGGVEAVECRATAPGPERDELVALLDQEIGRLPERYRAAVVLCDLGGLTHEEAARRLDCAVGTVGSRLARGRERLRSRLARRGLAPSAAAFAAALGEQRVRAAVPPALAEATAWAAMGGRAGGTFAAGVSPGAVSLTKGVLRTMYLTKLRLGAALALAIGGAAAFAQQGAEDARAPRAEGRGYPARPSGGATGGAGGDSIQEQDLWQAIEERVHTAREHQRAGRYAEALEATGRVGELLGVWREDLRAMQGRAREAPAAGGLPADTRRTEAAAGPDRLDLNWNRRAGGETGMSSRPGFDSAGKINPAAGQERRLRDLERKLERVMETLEDLTAPKVARPGDVQSQDPRSLPHLPMAPGARVPSNAPEGAAGRN